MKSFVEVYDTTEDGEFGSEKLLIPYLKDYLAKHPLLQFPDSPNGFEEVEYYLNKCIPPECVKETYIALALIIQDFFLTSSTCHPKFVGKERCNALMTFHEHCFADCLLVLRKVYLYCYDCLCERQHFVDAHPDL